MKTINLNKQEGVSFLLYPDNQPHVNISIPIYYSEEVKVVCSIVDSLKLIQLLQVSNALDKLFAKKKVLVIPYLMAARYDRVMVEGSGESFDLEVVASLINSCGFERVILFDVHSEVSLALIKNSTSIPNMELVRSYDIKDSVLICPDAGAAKKINKYFEWNKNIIDVVYCIKSRDLSNGNLTIKVLEPEKCLNKNCLIIDDLCDGGGTFLGIASQISPLYLTLIVTHGIFSKGVEILERKFDKIIVSNSYCDFFNSKKVKTINHPE